MRYCSGWFVIELSRRSRMRVAQLLQVHDGVLGFHIRFVALVLDEEEVDGSRI